MTMTCPAACSVIAEHRENSVVVSTTTAMFAISQISPSPLSISSVPLMGGAAGIGLGLALSNPDRKIIVLDGDASLLMEFGSLAMVAGQAPANFIHFVFNNNAQFEGVWNIGRPGGAEVDFAAAALAAGYKRTLTVTSEQDLEARMTEIMTGPAPVLIELKIEPTSIDRDSAIQPDMPDLQFTRMGNEARSLQAKLESERE